MNSWIQAVRYAHRIMVGMTWSQMSWNEREIFKRRMAKARGALRINQPMI